MEEVRRASIRRNLTVSTSGIMLVSYPGMLKINGCRPIRKQTDSGKKPPTGLPETQRLIDELFREEIIQARKLSPVEKALAGQRLFESACRITLAGTASVSRGIGRGMRGNPA